MFQSIRQQNFADILKGMVESAPSTPAQRRNALRAINVFEGEGWNPHAFEQVMALHAPGEFAFDATNHLTYTGTRQFAETVVTVLDAYLLMMRPPINGVYTIQQAAAYLHVSVEALRKAMSRNQAISPATTTPVLLFTRSELDRYAAEAAPVGKPRRTPRPHETA